jgi:hypothetical protein
LRLDSGLAPSARPGMTAVIDATAQMKNEVQE